MFWHHQWEFSGNSWLWIGLPENSRLNAFQGGSLGDYILGGSFIALPLNDRSCRSMPTPNTYPSGLAPGPAAYGESDLVSGRWPAIHVRRLRHSKSVAATQLPLLPVANNSNFLVDSVRTF